MQGTVPLINAKRFPRQFTKNTGVGQAPLSHLFWEGNRVDEGNVGPEEWITKLTSCKQALYHIIGSYVELPSSRPPPSGGGRSSEFFDS